MRFLKKLVKWLFKKTSARRPPRVAKKPAEILAPSATVTLPVLNDVMRPPADSFEPHRITSSTPQFALARRAQAPREPLTSYLSTPASAPPSPPPPPTPAPNPAPPSSKPLDSPLSSVGRRSTFGLRYVASGGEITERILTLYEFRGDPPYEYLIGFCSLRQEKRTFRSDRILALFDPVTGDILTRDDICTCAGETLAAPMTEDRDAPFRTVAEALTLYSPRLEALGWRVEHHRDQTSDTLSLHRPKRRTAGHLKAATIRLIRFPMRFDFDHEEPGPWMPWYVGSPRGARRFGSASEAATYFETLATDPEMLKIDP